MPLQEQAKTTRIITVEEHYATPVLSRLSLRFHGAGSRFPGPTAREPRRQRTDRTRQRGAPPEAVISERLAHTGDTY